MKKFKAYQPFLFSILWLSSNALADGAPPAKIDTGDTAWVLISSALVLLMTPGLAFFYGGMVKTKNVVSTLLQNYAALAVIGLLWGAVGYSLAFSGDVSGMIGNLNFAFLNGVGQEPNPDFSATIPHALFMLFQCMFAVITPALITGAIAERVRFKAWLAFMALWSLVVYAPVAHWLWGVNGWVRALGGLDFAGGLVVHMTAGYSALVAAMLIGPRKAVHASQNKPYDVGYVLLGTGLLWFGWFGFNAGSALGANGLAAQAFGTTFFASAAAFLSWMAVDTVMKGKPSAMGAGIGAVAGLVAITPGAGFVSFSSSVVIGLLAGAICNLVSSFIKSKTKIDDTLDVFGCHAVGGTLGTILTAVFCSKAVNSAGADGVIYGQFGVLKANLMGAGAVIGLSVVGTIICIKVVGLFTSFRVEEQGEKAGLDDSQHAELINSGAHAHGEDAPMRRSA